MRGSWAAVIGRIRLEERNGLKRLRWSGYGLVVWGMKDVAVLATAEDPRELEALRDEIAAWCGMEPVLREGRELRIGWGA